MIRPCHAALELHSHMTRFHFQSHELGVPLTPAKEKGKFIFIVI